MAEDRKRPSALGRVEVPLGNSVRGNVAPDATVVMFVAVGLSPDRLEQVVSEVAALQVMLTSFRPLFVTDCDQFHMFRRRQYLFEYIPPRAEWVARFGDADWQAFVDERIQLLLERYRPDRVIAFEDPERLTALRTGLFDALVTRPPAPADAGQTDGSGEGELLGPFPPTPVGQLVRRGAELYLNSGPVNPRRLVWRAGRFLNRRSRALRRGR